MWTGYKNGRVERNPETREIAPIIAIQENRRTSEKQRKSTKKNRRKYNDFKHIERGSRWTNSQTTRKATRRITED